MYESSLFAWRRQVREGLLVEAEMPVVRPMQMLGTPAAMAALLPSRLLFRAC